MEELNNFIITANPRSGTKFLAQVMNRSKKFTVMHDKGIGSVKRNKEWSIEKKLKEIQKIIEKNNYGEVSGNHRAFILDYKNVAKTGFIIRHPYKCLLSEANMNSGRFANKGSKIWETKDFKSKFETLDKIAQSVDKIIYFDKMTTDAEYLKEVLEFFGITDVKIDPKSLKNKVNQRGSRYKTLNDFSPKIKERITEQVDWYAEKYNLKLI